MLDVTPVLAQVDRRPEEIRFPGEPWSEIRRIVVIRNDRMGDLVLTLPAIHALRRCYPAAWIAVLVRGDLVPLARMAEEIDEVIADPVDSGVLVRILEEYRADLSLCVSREARSSWAVWKAGVPRRVGTGFRIYSPLFHRRVDEHRQAGTRHEVEYALAFAHRSGAGELDRVRFPLNVPETATESLGNWLALQKIEKPFVVLHPGDMSPCPDWPAAQFIELATLLEAEGIPVVFSLGMGNPPFSEMLDAEHPAIRSRPRFSGDAAALAALLSHCAALVGGSGGPVHLASALGIPTLAFHAPWSSCGVGRYGPYSENGWAIVAELEEAKHWSGRKRRKMADRLMAGIPATAALRCVRSFLQGELPTMTAAAGDPVEDPAG